MSNEHRPIDLIPEKLRDSLWSIHFASYRLFTDPYGPVYTKAKGILVTYRRGGPIPGTYYAEHKVHLAKIEPWFKEGFDTEVRLHTNEEGLILATHCPDSRMAPINKFEGELILTPHKEEFELYKGRLERKERLAQR